MVSLQYVSRDMPVILLLTILPSPFLLLRLGMHYMHQIHIGLERERKKLLKTILAKTMTIPIQNEHEQISEMETNALQPDYFETPK